MLTIALLMLAAAPFKPTVDETLSLQKTRGAKACVVHLHRQEDKAMRVGQRLYDEGYCINWLHIDTKGKALPRTVEVKIAPNKSCQGDPNRMFSERGLRDSAFKSAGCADKQKAIPALRAFATKLQDLLGACRLGAKKLPILALHNNSSMKAADVRPPEPVGAATGLFKNPEQGHGLQQNFFVATTKSDFLALRKSFNVLLQKKSMAFDDDDGSLSVVYRSARYLNLESRLDKNDADQLEMARKALELFGVRKDCN